MIKSLRIRNLATIEDLEVEFGDGLSILTGETGAGKSIIIDALRLLLGEKGSADSIRTGKSEAAVEAVFDVAGAKAQLKDFDVEEDGCLSVQRQISGQGPGRAYLNGVLVPIKKLKEAGLSTVNIYGQNDHIFLLNLENHLFYLDAYLDRDALRQDVSSAARELKSLLLQKQDLEAKQKERVQRLDFLAFQIREIESAGLKTGEDEALGQEREILKNAEKIFSLIDQALDLSYAQEESLLPLLSRFKNTLRELARFYPFLEASTQAMDEFSISLHELSNTLIKFKDGNTGAPESLEGIEQRLDVIDKLKRKYGPNIPDVLFYLEKIKTEFEDLTSNQEKLEGLDKSLRDAFELYSSKAGALSALRIKKARELEKLIEKEISQLGMKRAAFKVDIRTTSPSTDNPAAIAEKGTDDAEFLISPNPGEELRPLRRIASGGELSRVMLALKSLGKETESSRTLIFDEIDSGIGGQTAEFIAAKLKDLAARHQVICITHLPQIAATATHHFRVEKRIEKERTYTMVKKLDAGERIEEIARLISGSRITEASIQIAKEMLAGGVSKETTQRSRPSS